MTTSPVRPARNPRRRAIGTALSLPSPSSLADSPYYSAQSACSARFVRALYDFLPSSSPHTECLFFSKGSIIEVVYRPDATGWWDGEYNGNRGWFPSNFVGSMTETISQGVDVIQDGVKGRRGVKSSQSCVLDSSTVTQAIPNVGFKKRTAESPILSSDAPSRVELARALLDNDRRRETQRKSRSVTPPLSPSCIQPSQETPDLDWENCMEEVSRRMTDLFNAYASPACSNVQLMVFHIASSVRVLLQSTTHSLTDGHYAFPDEGQQRKAVLRALSKLIQKSTALQESAQVKADEQLRALANHLWMETLVFEEILQATISRKETLMTLEKASRSVQPKKPKQPLPDTDYVVRRLQYHRTSIEDLVADDLAAIFNKVDEEVSFSNKEIDRVKSLLLRNITELISMVESLSRQWREKKDTPTNNENSVAEIDTRHAPELEIDHITRREDRIINVSQQQENEPGTSNSVTDESFGTSSTGSSLSSFSSSASLISDELPDIRRSLKRSSLEIASLTPSTSMKSAGTVPDRKATKTSATPSRLSIQHSSVSSVIFSHRPTLPHPTVICSKSTPVMDKAATTRRRGRSISTLRISRKPMRIDLRPSSSASAFDTTTPNSFRGRLSSPLWLKRKSIGPVKSDAAEKEIENASFLKRQSELSEDQIMCNSEGQVMGATPEALVEWLTWPEKSPDPVFVCAFFHNFRLFMDPSEFLQLLIKRFHLDAPITDDNTPLSPEELKLWEMRILSPVRLAIYNVIKLWLEKYFDVQQDLNTKLSLLEFTRNDLIKAVPDSVQQLMDLIEHKFSATIPECNPSSGEENKHVTSKSPDRESTALASYGHPEYLPLTTNYYPSPHITRPLKNMLRKALSNQDSSSLSNVTLYRLEPLEVARQLTLMESALFCQIHSSEILAAQESRKTISKSVHVKTMIQRSTQLVYWISNTILREPDAKRRVNVIKYWIKVSDHCLQLSNYNTLMAIRCALSSASIARLKQMWDAVSRSAKHKAMYDNISRVADSQRNFALYRKCLKTATAPCLPFLGIYLSDMVFIDQGNPNHRTSNQGQFKLVNFDKYIKMARILNEIEQFQVPYKFKEVEEIQRYLSQCLKAESAENNEDAFYSRSLEIEPRIDDTTFTPDTRPADTPN